jgi:hypothetical protein
MQWRRGVDLVLSVYGGGPCSYSAGTLEIYFPSSPASPLSSRNLQIALLSTLCYTIQLAFFNMSTYDGSDVDIIFAGGGTAAC